MESVVQTGPKVPVTAIINRRVRPGREHEFEEWQRGITTAASGFVGYAGITILRPSGGQQDYVIILQFDHPGSLHGWMESEVRRDWIKRSEPFVEAPGDIHEITGMEHWFTLPGRPSPRPAPRHKMWILSWLSAFGLSTAITYAMGGLLARLPRPLNLLALTFLMTGIMTYLLMPGITRLFWGWLYPPLPPEKR